MLANNADNTANDIADGDTVAISGTSDALATLDSSLKAVDEQRSQLGAIQNRFESAITNLSAARSRIEDADYAIEVADMTKNQILQNVLSLLG